MWVISDPRHFTRHQRKFTRDTRPAAFRLSRYFWPPSPPSFFLGTNTSPTLLGSQALFPLTHSDRPTFLSSFVVTFKKRCLYSFIGICGTWMHRFAFWKFYLKSGLITSFRSALRSVRMHVRNRVNNLFDASRVTSVLRLIQEDRRRLCSQGNWSDPRLLPSLLHGF